MQRHSIAMAMAIHAALSTAAMADPMSGKDVQAFFGAGSFKAAAGSIFDFQPNGTFSIAHTGGSESGSWSVAPDGTVTRLRDGASKPDVFYIDVNARGKRTIVYTAGRYKGKKFPLR